MSRRTTQVEDSRNLFKQGVRVFACLTALICVSESAVAASCTVVSVPNLSFGAYGLANLTGANLDGATTVTVDCNRGLLDALGSTLSYTLKLNSGPGSYAARQMASGGFLLNYNLYRNSARTEIWGNGTSGTFTVGGSFTFPLLGGNPPPNLHTMYGRIGGGQNPAPGTYLTATVITLTMEY